MKKILLTIMIVVLAAVVLVSCNNDKKHDHGFDTTENIDTLPPDTGTGDVTTEPTPVYVPDIYGLGKLTDTGSDADFDYEIYENGAVIVAYKGDKTDVTLPTTFAMTGAKVLAVGKDAFSGKAVKSVTVPEGFTVIGDYAFMSCADLESVKLPATLEKIGEGAFKFDEKLAAVELPAGLKEIGGRAFYDCTALKSVKIPEGVTTLNDSVFFTCTSLESAELPAALALIGDNAFYNCPALKTINVPAAVTEIGKFAFYNCTGLSAADLPAGVEKIGQGAYMGCTGISCVVFPASITSIGNGAFSGCTALESVSFTEPAKDAEGKYETTFTIGSAAFAECTALKAIALPANMTGAVSGGMFNGCTSLSDIKINYAPSDIGDYAFSGTAIKGIEIPIGTMNKFGAKLFLGCTSLESIEIPEGIRSSGSNLFEGCTALKSIKFPATLVTVPEDCCSGCTALEDVTIQQGTVRLGQKSFYDCSSLKEIELPSTISEIRNYAIGCRPGEAVFDIYKPDGTVEQQTLPTPYTYDNNVTIYGFTNSISEEYATKYKMSFVALGNHGENPFADFDYTIEKRPVEVEVTDEETGEVTKVMEDKEFVTFLKYKGTATTVVIPTTINDAVAEKIGDHCFDGREDLVSVKIPDTVISIGDYAFYKCTALSKLTCPTKITHFGKYAFAYMPINITPSFRYVTEIPEGVCMGCSELRSVVMDVATLKSVGDYAFSGTQLNAFSVPTGLEYLGKEALLGCTGAKTLSFPDTLKKIGDHAFGYVLEDGAYKPFNGLEHTVISEKFNPDWKEGDPEEQKYITVETTETYTLAVSCFIGGVVDDYAKNLALGEKDLTYLGYTGEAPFKNFTFVDVKDASGNVIGCKISAANGLSTYTSLVVPTKNAAGVPVIEIGSSALKGLKIETIVLPDTLETIGDMALASCNNLKYVEFPAGLKKIGSNVFMLSNAVKKVVFKGGDLTLTSTTPFAALTNLDIYVVPGSAAETAIKGLNINFSEGYGVKDVADYKPEA